MHIYIILVYKFFFKIRATLWDHVLFRSLGNKGALHNIFILVSMYCLDLFRPVGLWAKKKRCTKLYIVADLVAAKPTFSQGVWVFHCWGCGAVPAKASGPKKSGLALHSKCLWQAEHWELFLTWRVPPCIILSMLSLSRQLHTNCTRCRDVQGCIGIVGIFKWIAQIFDYQCKSYDFYFKLYIQILQRRRFSHGGETIVVSWGWLEHVRALTVAPA